MENYKIQPKIINFMSSEVTDSKFMSIEVSPSFSNISIKEVSPLFYSVVWKTPKDMCLLAVNEENLSDIPALKLAQVLCGDGKVVMMHITCVDMSFYSLYIILKKLQSLQIRNILALQGDGIQSSKCKDFQYAPDIVKYARKIFGDYFCIGVAGDPSYNDDIDYFKHLKEKIDCGADFIITQVIYESRVFESFVHLCKISSINVPIIPALYMCNSYDSLQRMLSITGVKLPFLLSSEIEDIKSYDNAVMNIMKKYLLKLVLELKNSKSIYGIHWCSVNDLKALNLTEHK